MFSSILNQFHSNDKRSDPEEELIRTEETYVNELTTLVETFVVPLEKWLTKIQLVKGKQNAEYCLDSIVLENNVDIVQGLFSNIKVILDCNRLMLDSLQTAYENDDNCAVVMAFLRHAPYLKLYSQYSKNYHRATSLLSQLMNDSRFAAFIACAELQKQCHGLNLQAFLIMPVQRGPRYELLLKEMLKQTKDESKRLLIQDALHTIVKVIKNIDHAASGQENKLIELQEAFKISLTEPARSFVRCGYLKKVCHSGRKTFFFVLCSDIIFYGEELAGRFSKSSNKQRYKFHREFSLDEIHLVLMSNNSKSFIIRGIDKVFEVEASSPEECASWVDDLLTMKSVKRLKVQSKSSQKNAHNPTGGSVAVNGFGPVFRLWQIDPVTNNTVIRKYTIPFGISDTSGVLLMDDLIGEDEAYDSRPSSMSRPSSTTRPTSTSASGSQRSHSLTTISSTSSVQRPSSVSASQRTSRSSTVTQPNALQLQQQYDALQKKRAQDIFGTNELLVPTKPFETKLSTSSKDASSSVKEINVSEGGSFPSPPKLHSIWSVDMEMLDDDQTNLHREDIVSGGLDEHSGQGQAQDAHFLPYVGDLESDMLYRKQKQQHNNSSVMESSHEKDDNNGKESTATGSDPFDNICPIRKSPTTGSGVT
mmetsp:Transcript_2416/g.3706  ORF Transcript_2416/g.3706 Transcript_2416/m.3706 type:complete len:647 (+) Transcript_2416:234-2174(+)|eukprot:CAMPEP_0185020210 /NCGR_PEP_ID=MMETSP1103-20130426/2809_1 /TAXON_ID=36769 /ORGANISM="Paraphysomonas bandaiensis, Strain Caron Lab Isolate" /LENGTH=646 /DNA_ID=CAMNT_0027550971 /DNA_START=149 /DNA_END=2089 /DNA_ORIENTATION=+